MLAAALLLSAAQGAAATPALDRLSVGIGSFSNRLQIEGRVDGRTEFDGSPRDFDETLDVGNRRRIGVWEASWLIGDRHQLDFRHYDDERRREVAIDEEIRFNGEVFPVQGALRGRAGFDLDELTYTWWFRPDEVSPLGLQLGVLRLEGYLGLGGRIAIDEVGEAEGETTVRDRLHAPLIGLAGRRQLGRQWRLYGEGRLIRLKVSGIHGTALSGRVGIEFLATRHLGIALQYGGARVDGRKRDADFAGELELGFGGPQLLLRLRY
jgi:hypothetical protein